MPLGGDEGEDFVMRNSNIDIMRAVCAVLVVLIHTTFVGRDYLMPITRVAVPLFFMISGFFMYTTDGATLNSRTAKALKKIGFLLLWSLALYFVYQYLTDGRHMGWRVNPKGLAISLFFSCTPFCGSLWYLCAYLYVLIIINVCNSLNIVRLLPLALPVLILGMMALGPYDQLIFGVNFPIHYSRNWLFDGLPFFLLGWVVRKHGERLSHWHCAPWLALAFLAMSYVETIYCADSDFYAGTLWASFFLFVAVANAKASDSRCATWLARIGREDSLYLYIFHRLTQWALRDTATLFGFEATEESYEFLLVVVVTLLGIRIVRRAYTYARR